MDKAIRYNNIIDSAQATEAQAAADAAPGLPASAIDADRFYITQQYTKYTREDHEVWRDLFDRRWTMLERQVSRQFIDGMKILRLTREEEKRLAAALRIELATGGELARLKEKIRGWVGR